jgi:hypothetical protein
MLGKISSLLSYWKVLEVYTLKRFPSSKLPLFGMVSTYLFLYYNFNSINRQNSISILKKEREALENRCLSEWTFNSSK